MLASAALLSVAAASAPAAYPVRDVLDAFATACAEVGDTAANLADAQEEGWEKLAPDADTPASRLARQGREVLRKQAPEAKLIDGAEFRKTVAGRTLYLAISGVETEITSRGCRVFDFGAPRAPTVKEMREWAGRDPSSRYEPVPGVTRIVWQPGLKPEHPEMEVYFIAPGKSPLPGLDTSGLTLVASALE